ETTLVSLDDIRKPIRSRQCANKNEHGTRWNTLSFICIGAKHRNFFQVCVTMDLDYAGVCPQLNFRGLTDLINQVLRHGAGKLLPSHQDRDTLRVPGKVQSRLTCRVRAAYDIDDLILAGQCLGSAAT